MADIPLVAVGSRRECTARAPRALVRALARALTLGSLLSPAAAQLPPGFVDEAVVLDLALPMGVAFLPDGRGLVWEKSGVVLVFDPGSLPATPALYMSLVGVESGGERGLIDITIDPQFASNSTFYALYVHAISGRTRVSRFLEQAGVGQAASEVVLWESSGTWGSCCHYGGGLDVAADGSLWFTTGEQFDGAQAQDLGTSLGKLLRIRSDGSIPPDNPFLGTPGALPSLYAYGLRNPFRARFDDATGHFYIGEVGGNVQSTAREDIHLGVAGANYGWPHCEGDCGDPTLEPPLFSYPHAGSGASVTGGVVYRGSSFPAPYHGAYFYADYVRRWVRYLVLDGAGSVTADLEFHPDYGNTVAIEQDAAGALYFVQLDASGPGTFGGEVRRVRYVPSNPPPSITLAQADVTEGPVPLEVTFTGAASDPDQDPLEARWLPGDGTRIDGEEVSHTYTANGPYGATFVVSDGTTTVVSHPILVQVGEVPSVQISSPVEGTRFRFGDVIDYAAQGSDSDGPVGDASFSWRVRFVRAENAHPALGPVAGASGQFEIPLQGQGFSGDVHYELVVTLTDSDGLVAMDSVRIFPEKIDLLFDTDPPGVPVVVDGNVARRTPFLFDTLVRLPHTISVPESACLDGASLDFFEWSDGGARLHGIVVPDSDASFRATFRPTGPCGRQLAFDGVDDIVRVPSFVLAGDFTIEARVRIDGTVSNADGILARKLSAPAMDINFFQGRARLWTNHPAWDVLIANAVHVPGTWVHYAFRRAGNSLRLYVNGQLDATGSWNGTFALDSLGAANAGFFGGKLDDVRIWSLARSAADIAAYQVQPVSPSSPGLLAYWTFDEPFGEQLVVDLSPARAHGTLGASGAVASDDPLRESSEANLVPPAEGDLVAGRGRGLAFDGRDDVVRLPSFTLPGDFTLEFWASLERRALRAATPVLGAEASGGAPGDTGLGTGTGPGAAGVPWRTRPPERHGLLHDSAGSMDVRFDDGRAAWWAGDSVGDVLVANLVQLGADWTHYAFARSGPDVTLFINGVPDATAAWGAPFAFDTLGRGQRDFLDGRLEDVRLWTIARTPEEIASTYDSVLPAASPGLLAYWTFDESDSGPDAVVVDVSPNGENGTLGAGPGPGSDRPRRVDTELDRGLVHGIDRRLAFDGVDDIARVPRIELAGDFTIEARVRLDGTITGADGLLADVIGAAAVDLDFDQALLRLRAGVPGGDVLVATTPHPSGAWVHYAVVRAGADLALYVDGRLDATGSWSGTFAFDSLGRARAGFLAGALDEVRVWDRARPALDIAAHHVGGVHPLSPGLVAYWTFDEAPADQIVRDLSPAARHGTLGASPAPASDDPLRE